MRSPQAAPDYPQVNSFSLFVKGIIQVYEVLFCYAKKDSSTHGEKGLFESRILVSLNFYILNQTNEFYLKIDLFIFSILVCLRQHTGFL